MQQQGAWCIGFLSRAPKGASCLAPPSAKHNARPQHQGVWLACAASSPTIPAKPDRPGIGCPATACRLSRPVASCDAAAACSASDSRSGPAGSSAADCISACIAGVSILGRTSARPGQGARRGRVSGGSGGGGGAHSGCGLTYPTRCSPLMQTARAPSAAEGAAGEATASSRPKHTLGAPMRCREPT